MNPNQLQLVQILRQRLLSSLNQLDQETAQLSDGEIAKSVFTTTSRNSRPNSCRLTENGLLLYRSHFDHWVISINDYHSNILKIVELDRAFVTPWFLAIGWTYKDNPHIVVFESTAAMRLKLCEGDLDYFIKLTKKV